MVWVGVGAPPSDGGMGNEEGPAPGNWGTGIREGPHPMTGALGRIHLGLEVCVRAHSEAGPLITPCSLNGKAMNQGTHTLLGQHPICFLPQLSDRDPVSRLPALPLRARVSYRT